MDPGDEEIVKESRISVHLTKTQKEDLVRLLNHYIDVFSCTYDDMPGMSTSSISHKLPINPDFNMIKQKTQMFKPQLSLRIKE